MHEKDAKTLRIAEKLKNARISVGMTQAQAAQALGMTAQAISHFERGRNRVASHILADMCNLYGLDIRETLDYSDDDEGKKTFESPASKEDTIHIQRYLKLDAHGKEVVNSAIDLEYKRVTEKSKRFIVKRTDYLQVPFAARGGGLQKSNEKRAKHLQKLEEYYKKEGDGKT